MHGLALRPATSDLHLRGVASAARALVLTGAVVLAALGALVAPIATLLGAPAAALAAAAVAGCLQPDSDRAIWVAAVAGGLVVPWIAGVGTLGGAGAVAVVGFLLLGAVWAGRAVVVASSR